jgi:hypothetical protein
MVFPAILKAAVQVAVDFMLAAAGGDLFVKLPPFGFVGRLPSLPDELLQLGVLAGAALIILQRPVHSPRVDRMPVDDGVIVHGGAVSAAEAQGAGVIGGVDDIRAAEALPAQEGKRPIVHPAPVIVRAPEIGGCDLANLAAQFRVFGAACIPLRVCLFACHRLQGGQPAHVSDHLPEEDGEIAIRLPRGRIPRAGSDTVKFILLCTLHEANGNAVNLALAEAQAGGLGFNAVEQAARHRPAQPPPCLLGRYARLPRAFSGMKNDVSHGRSPPPSRQRVVARQWRGRMQNCRSIEIKPDPFKIPFEYEQRKKRLQNQVAATPSIHCLYILKTTLNRRFNIRKIYRFRG